MSHANQAYTAQLMSSAIAPTRPTSIGRPVRNATPAAATSAEATTTNAASPVAFSSASMSSNVASSRRRTPTMRSVSDRCATAMTDLLALAALVLRFALLDEGLHTLASILAPKEPDERSALRREPLRERRAEALDGRELDLAARGARAARVLRVEVALREHAHVRAGGEEFLGGAAHDDRPHRIVRARGLDRRIELFHERPVVGIGRRAVEDDVPDRVLLLEPNCHDERAYP